MTLALPRVPRSTVTVKTITIELNHDMIEGSLDICDVDYELGI